MLPNFIMPSKGKPTSTFVDLYSIESSVALPTNDGDISAALDSYEAKYAKGTSKRCKSEC